MKVSLIQIASNGSLEENKKRSLGFMKEALSDNPDLICLSEMFIAWGDDFFNIKLRTEDIADFQTFAKENNVNIILGTVPVVIENSEKVTNTSFVIGRNGEIIGRYDKQYLYTCDRKDFKIDEGARTQAVDNFGLFVIDGIKVGIGICFDVRFPEYFRSLTKQGAELMFLPSHFREATGMTAWNILPEARAIENQAFFCACNQTGPGIIGKTKAVSYDGTLLGAMGKEEGILTVDLDFERLREFRKDFPVLAQQR